jgi:O-antigen ligase
LGCVLALGSIVPAPTRAAFRILLATVGLAAGLLFLGGTPVVPRIDEPTSSRDRFDLALASAEMVLAHPVTGVGYGNFDLLQVDFFNRGRHFGGVAFNKEFWDGASHNALLTPFAELGIFVGALNLGFLLSRLLAGLKPISRTPAGKSIYHPVLICGSLMVVAFMVNGVLVDFRNTATPTLLLWSFAALVERYRWTLVASPEPAGSVDERSTPADHAPRIREPAGVA